MTKDSDMGSEENLTEDELEIRASLEGESSDGAADPAKDPVKEKEDGDSEKEAPTNPTKSVSKKDPNADDPEKKEPDADPKKKTDKEDKSDPKGGNDPEGGKSTLKEFFDKEPATRVPSSEKYPSLKEGDYKINEDGKVEISKSADHLIKDIEALQDDMGIGVKISKAKPEKWEVIAKSYGWKDSSDGTAGKAAILAIKGYLAAQKADDQEKMDRILLNEFPEELRYSDSDPNYLVVDEVQKDPNKKNLAERESREGDEKVTPGFPYTKDELTNAVDSFVKDKYNKEDREAAKENILENPELLEKLAKPRFNPDTGVKLTALEHFGIIADEVVKDSKDLPKGVTVQIGGGKIGNAGGESNDLEGGDEQKAIREALANVKI